MIFESDADMSHTRKRKVYVLIPAAGSGSRMNLPVNKPFIEIDGVPVICRTVEAFNSHPDVSGIVIITSEADYDRICQIAKQNEWMKLAGIAIGGQTRQASVFKGLQFMYEHILTAEQPSQSDSHIFTQNCAAEPSFSESGDRKSNSMGAGRESNSSDIGRKSGGASVLVSEQTDDSVVLVHDGARCFISHEVIDRVIRGISEKQACGAAMPVKETIKNVGDNGCILSTLERKTLWSMQTPQGAFCRTLIQAYRHASQKNFEGTDDLSVLEFFGVQTYVTEGSDFNIKLTTPFDLLLAEQILCQMKA